MATKRELAAAERARERELAEAEARGVEWAMETLLETVCLGAHGGTARHQRCRCPGKAAKAMAGRAELLRKPARAKAVAR